TGSPQASLGAFRCATARSWETTVRHPTVRFRTHTGDLYGELTAGALGSDQRRTCASSLCGRTPPIPAAGDRRRSRVVTPTRFRQPVPSVSDAAQTGRRLRSRPRTLAAA